MASLNFFSHKNLPLTLRRTTYFSLRRTRGGGLYNPPAISTTTNGIDLKFGPMIQLHKGGRLAPFLTSWRHYCIFYRPECLEVQIWITFDPKSKWLQSFRKELKEQKKLFCMIFHVITCILQTGVLNGGFWNSGLQNTLLMTSWCYKMVALIIVSHNTKFYVSSHYGSKVIANFNKILTSL